MFSLRITPTARAHLQTVKKEKRKEKEKEMKEKRIEKNRKEKKRQKKRKKRKGLLSNENYKLLRHFDLLNLK